MPFLQVGLGVVSAGALSACLFLPALRDATGFPLPIWSFVLAVAVACGASALGQRTRWQAACNWLALTAIGQAAALQAIRAGPSVHYQHYRVAEGGAGWIDGAACVVLAIQAACVVRALWPLRSGAVAWLRCHLGVVGTAVVGGLFVVTAAFPSREPGVYAAELVFSTFVRGVSLGSIAATVLALPDAERRALAARVDGLLSRASPNAHWPGFVLACAAVATLASASLAWFSYERQPHVPDEVAYLMHARYFAEGELGTPAPSVPEAFDVYLWPCEERCHSPVPPGWPAALAVGVVLGAPWLLNPILAGLGVLLCYRLLALLYDERTARLSAALLALSPWYATVSMSLMTHAFSLVCATIAASCVGRMERKPEKQGRLAIAGGVAIGLVSLTRPLEGVVVAGVLGLAALGVRGQRFRFAPVIVLGVVTAAVGALVFPYNAAITGSATTFPIMAYADQALGPGVNALGFGPDRGIHWGGLDPFPGHGLPDVIVNSLLNTTAIDGELFGWMFGSLLPVALLPFVGRLRRNDAWLAGFVAAIVVAQAFYWYSGGPDFAARYWYLAIVPLVGLGARGLCELDAFSEATSGRGTLLGAALALSLVAFATVLPWRAVDKYHHYRGVQAGMREIVADARVQGALLLVTGEQHPDYAGAIVYSALDPFGPETVVAWDRSEAVRERLLSAYPQRDVFVVDGPTQTGRGYELRPEPLRRATPGSHETSPDDASRRARE